ncbi:asparagine synthase (glutamine-hydrolyzing) [Dictyobacter arantiisoli]|uniref:asparagine synthase (glutamine-hydrolyzing) n=1 Tax=Dictyobacter arantiisoli TaxID=2014874 RepID=A0A5A5TB44_9CHLR|nr:asparagine synthase (glutamine-hydrolyzing) [Dictyobacter arantiisoli]GCF08219.1 asparagine synthetase B [Dictyobacter arantiisoli]
MCGIAGFVNLHGGYTNAEQLIDTMCQIIRHRGPDDQGTWIGEHQANSTNVALGMRRLAIIDLVGSHQPIFNEDKSKLIVFNGEIYNYRELQQELRERGHQFQTDGDTETILHAYEEYGDDCVNLLRGMFTFAIWDIKRQRLFAARDRFGKKPLNYYWDGQRLIFGSEIKSILTADIPREINPLALDEYLVYRYVPSPLTLFKNVMKVPPAHVLVYENGEVSTKRYWDISFAHICHDDEETAIARARALLEEAIRIRLMSEVPLGAFLSGGLDSSIVVGMMSRIMTQPVKTFSIGFEDDKYNELPHARKVAQYFGTDHHEFFVKYDLVSILPQLVWAYDEPFADSSMLPTYYVSKLAREHVTVALSGDGGDEIFGGYEQYRREYQIYHVPQLLRETLAHSSSLLPDGIRGKKRLQTWLKDFGTRNIEAMMLFPGYSRAAIYSKEFFQQVKYHQPYERHLEIYRRVAQLDPTARIQYADTLTYLPDDILVKVDKASMFNSLETRAPLLDHKLAEYVASLDPQLRVNNGNIHNGSGKYLLQKVAQDLLPSEIIKRPKRGFAVPIEEWFRKDMHSYAHDILGSEKARNRGIFNQKLLEELLRTDGRSTITNHSQVLWTLLCLELWFQTYMDDATTQAPLVDHLPQQDPLSRR